MASGEHAAIFPDDYVAADGPPMTEDDWHQENAEALAAIYAEACGDAPCALHVHRSAPVSLPDAVRLAYRKGAAMALRLLNSVACGDPGCEACAEHALCADVEAAVREELGLAEGEPLDPQEAHEDAMLASVCPGCHAVNERCAPGCIDDEMRREVEDEQLYGGAEMAVTACDDPNDGVEPSVGDWECGDDADATWPGTGTGRGAGG